MSEIQVSIIGFAQLKTLFSQSSHEFTFPEGATVQQLKQAVWEQYPEQDHLLKTCLIATSTEYLSDQTPLIQGQEYAWIPPVSGG